jgi:hypothetical protein
MQQAGSNHTGAGRSQSEPSSLQDRNFTTILGNKGDCHYPRHKQQPAQQQRRHLTSPGIKTSQLNVPTVKRLLFMRWLQNRRIDRFKAQCGFQLRHEKFSFLFLASIFGARGWGCAVDSQLGTVLQLGILPRQFGNGTALAPTGILRSSNMPTWPRANN